MSSTFLTRFAPSPTGYLHLGHAFAAKQAFETAREFKGQCLLRIEDIDHTRCRDKYAQAIYEDLTWLGFNWPQPVRIQSQHLYAYDGIIENLRDRDLVYRCFLTRKDIPSGIFRSRALPGDQERAKLIAGAPFAWRLSIERCRSVVKRALSFEETGLDAGIHMVDMDKLSDEVVARKDIGTSYHIACCHDDAAQGITHIIRGADIAPLTSFQRLLQALMGWPTPIYHHHALLKNSDGDKLAKRNKDTSIRQLREQGFTPAEVLDMATL